MILRMMKRDLVRWDGCVQAGVGASHIDRGVRSYQCEESAVKITRTVYEVGRKLIQLGAD